MRHFCSRRNRAAPRYQCGALPALYRRQHVWPDGSRSVVQVPGRCVAKGAILHAVTQALLPAIGATRLRPHGRRLAARERKAGGRCCPMGLSQRLALASKSWLLP